MAVMQQLIQLALTAVINPKPLPDDLVVGTVQVLRDRIGGMRDHPGFDKALLGQLGIFESVTAEKLIAKGRNEVGKPLIIEAVALLEEGRLVDYPNQWFLCGYITALLRLAIIDSRDGETDQAFRCLDKAELLIPTIRGEQQRDPPGTRCPTRVCKSRMNSRHAENPNNADTFCNPTFECWTLCTRRNGPTPGLRQACQKRSPNWAIGTAW